MVPPHMRRLSHLLQKAPSRTILPLRLLLRRKRIFSRTHPMTLVRCSVRGPSYLNPHELRLFPYTVGFWTDSQRPFPQHTRATPKAVELTGISFCPRNYVYLYSMGLVCVVSSHLAAFFRALADSFSAFFRCVSLTRSPINSLPLQNQGYSSLSRSGSLPRSLVHLMLGDLRR